jgi:FG-GAP-like repeat
LAVAIGDLNGDGKPDLAVSDYEDSAVSVSALLNRGAGSFATKVDYHAGPYAAQVAIADVDGDGTSDLVIAHSGSGKAVSVLLGKGEGIFGRARRYATGEPSSETALAIGDLNEDGRPDVVTAAGCGVSALFGRKKGVFGAVRERLWADSRSET